MNTDHNGLGEYDFPTPRQWFKMYYEGILEGDYGAVIFAFIGLAYYMYRGLEIIITVVASVAVGIAAVAAVIIGAATAADYLGANYREVGLAVGGLILLSFASIGVGYVAIKRDWDRPLKLENGGEW